MPQLIPLELRMHGSFCSLLLRETENPPHVGISVENGDLVSILADLPHAAFVARYRDYIILNKAISRMLEQHADKTLAECVDVEVLGTLCIASGALLCEYDYRVGEAMLAGASKVPANFDKLGTFLKKWCPHPED